MMKCKICGSETNVMEGCMLDGDLAFCLGCFEHFEALNKHDVDLVLHNETITLDMIRS